MTLLWFDGFESYADSIDANRLSNIYTAGLVYGTLYGRNNRGVRLDGTGDYWTCKVTDTPATVIFGCVFKLNTTILPSYSFTYPFVTFYDAFPTGNIHLKFHLNSSRLIEVRNSADALIATTSGHSINANTWYYLEIKAKISDTVGQITININDVEVLSTSADKDTQNGTNAYVEAIGIKKVYNVDTHIDDLYICDTSGSQHNDFLGDKRVDPVRSDAAGTYTQFTPSAGSNYQNVDETPGPDDDTTYNDDGTVGHKDSYNMGLLPSPAGTTIHGFKSQITVRKTDAGSRKCKPLTRSGTTDTLGTEIVLSDSFTTHFEIYEDNPDDSEAWADADINAVQVGVEVTV